MTIKRVKPTSPGRRFQEYSGFDEITKKEPEKKLTKVLSKKAGRNNLGRITARHRGGGHKRKYRIIDFKRNKDDIQSKIIAIEYDPNRSARIALLSYNDGEKRYIIAPQNLKVGDKISSGKESDIKIGNCLKLKDIPLGTHIHNIELYPGKGAQLVRSAGTFAQLVSKEGKYAQIRLPSSEVRMILVNCKATIGQVGNSEHANISLGKAGRKRWKGRRPHVRGVAMNPVDHPMGGGEGRSSGGRHPCSPWGKPTKGYKTRRNKKSNSYIVKKRKN